MTIMTNLNFLNLLRRTENVLLLDILKVCISLNTYYYMERVQYLDKKKCLSNNCLLLGFYEIGLDNVTFAYKISNYKDIRIKHRCHV